MYAHNILFYITWYKLPYQATPEKILPKLNLIIF